VSLLGTLYIRYPEGTCRTQTARGSYDINLGYYVTSFYIFFGLFPICLSLIYYQNISPENDNCCITVFLCQMGHLSRAARDQSRSQSMPVRGLCSGMTLGKSNRNRYLIGCCDHQCCRHINARFFARITRGHTRRENYQCLSNLECEIKQYKSKDIILIV
jgi:hypothetical protein